MRSLAVQRKPRSGDAIVGNEVRHARLVPFGNLVEVEADLVMILLRDAQVPYLRAVSNGLMADEAQVGRTSSLRPVLTGVADRARPAPASGCGGGSRPEIGG